MKKAERQKDTLITALVANKTGEIFELDGYGAVGMDGSVLEPLTVGVTRKMPYGSELMYLPDRKPVVFDMETGRIEMLTENPYERGEKIFPVAAFNSPGYVVTHASAYRETQKSAKLPLFSYGAVGWLGEDFRSAVVLVDPEPRQDLRRMQHSKVVAGVEKLRREIPNNRLREHLENCALTYGCPAGKNFFLGRYEAPLPTSMHCNARCLGCLSLQQRSEISHSQDRINFTPSAEEITEVALTHIKRVKKSVVSFGQGCEGDPLLAAAVIEPAIRQIRADTVAGTINLNTNASLPDTVRDLFEAGLDSMRVSLNSVRPKCYDAYFRPQGYQFADVLKSIDMAIGHGKFVAINYLNMPGFTDTPAEIEALVDFLTVHPISMIQWRNLNFDPLRYLTIMNAFRSNEEPIGMSNVLKRIQKQFPNLKFGYFNPPKENFNEIH